MIALPNDKDLLEHVRASLDAVGRIENEISTPDWFIRIASEVAKRVSDIGLKCYARGKPDPCVGHEFLWDFSAFIEEDDVPENERIAAAQVAIIGEVEWAQHDHEIDKDFEKLLYSDSIACFMTFQKPTAEGANEKFNQLERVVSQRQKRARIRGLNRPPAFLLSCWILRDHKFEHRNVSSV